MENELITENTEVTMEYRKGGYPVETLLYV